MIYMHQLRVGGLKKKPKREREIFGQIVKVCLLQNLLEYYSRKLVLKQQVLKYKNRTCVMPIRQSLLSELISWIFWLCNFDFAKSKKKIKKLLFLYYQGRRFCQPTKKNLNWPKHCATAPPGYGAPRDMICRLSPVACHKSPLVCDRYWKAVYMSPVACHLSQAYSGLSLCDRYDAGKGV